MAKLVSASLLPVTPGHHNAVTGGWKLQIDVALSDSRTRPNGLVGRMVGWLYCDSIATRILLVLLYGTDSVRT